VQPSRIKFSVSEEQQDAQSIIGQLRAAFDKALFENVKVWKESIRHIPNYRQLKTEPLASR
jgi:hypothetical protein